MIKDQAEQKAMFSPLHIDLQMTMRVSASNRKA